MRKHIRPFVRIAFYCVPDPYQVQAQVFGWRGQGFQAARCAWAHFMLPPVFPSTGCDQLAQWMKYHFPCEFFADSQGIDFEW